MRGKVLPFGPPKVSREKLSFGSPNDIWELTRVPPGQARKIGCFISIPRKSGGNLARSPGIPGKTGFKKLTRAQDVEINSMVDRHTLHFICL